MQQHADSLPMPPLTTSETISNRDFLAALAIAVTALIISAALLAGGYFALATRLHPGLHRATDTAPVQPRVIPGRDFRPLAIGKGGNEGSVAVIRELIDMPPERGALLVHHGRFQAREFPFVRAFISGRNPDLRVTLFWQRADTPGKIFSTDLQYAGEGGRVCSLLYAEEWHGTITELAIGFFGDLRGAAIRLEAVVMEPYGLRALLGAVRDQWQAFTPWGQSSINVYRGAPDDALVFPVPAVAAWVVLASVLIAGFYWLRRQRPGSHPALAIICAVSLGWWALDTNWTRLLLQQHQETRLLFAGKSLHERKLADWDGDLYHFAHTIKSDFLPQERQNLAILRQPGQGTTYAHRLRYHLLPEHHVTWMPVASDRKFALGERYDYVILLADADSLRPGPAAHAAAMGLELTRQHTRVYASGSAALYRVEGEGTGASKQAPLR